MKRVDPELKASASDEEMFSRRRALSSTVRCTPISFMGRTPAISTRSMSTVRAVESRCARAGPAQSSVTSMAAMRSTSDYSVRVTVR